METRDVSGCDAGLILHLRLEVVEDKILQKQAKSVYDSEKAVAYSTTLTKMTVVGLPNFAIHLIDLHKCQCSVQFWFFAVESCTGIYRRRKYRLSITWGKMTAHGQC